MSTYTVCVNYLVMCATCVVSFNRTYKVDITINPILQMGKMRHKEV